MEKKIKYENDFENTYEKWKTGKALKLRDKCFPEVLT